MSSRAKCLSSSVYVFTHLCIQDRDRIFTTTRSYVPSDCKSTIFASRCVPGLICAALGSLEPFLCDASCLSVCLDRLSHMGTWGWCLCRRPETNNPQEQDNRKHVGQMACAAFLPQATAPLPVYALKGATHNLKPPSSSVYGMEEPHR